MLKIILIVTGIIFVIWIIKSIASSHLTSEQQAILNKPIVRKLTLKYNSMNLNSPGYDAVSRKKAKNLSKGRHPYL